MQRGDVKSLLPADSVVLRVYESIYQTKGKQVESKNILRMIPVPYSILLEELLFTTALVYKVNIDFVTFCLAPICIYAVLLLVL